MEQYQSQLLVANPELPDGNFFRSVVFLIHHDEEGAFGVILNRPTHFALNEVWYAITKENCPLSSSIYMGGPVEGPLIAIHDQEAFSENKVMDGVYISSDKENLQQLFESETGNCKIFSGYSGWGAGQLEAELETGSWFLTSASDTDLFTTADELWESVVGRIGSRILFPGASESDLDQHDPSLN